MNFLTDLKDKSAVALTQKTIRFTGPPDFLTGEVVFENKSREDYHISAIPLEHKALKELNFVRFDAFQVNSDINAGQKLTQNVRMSLDPHTKPGIIEMKVVVGGVKKSIILEIQPSCRLEVNPQEMIFLGMAPGMVHRKEIQVSNEGNVRLSFSLSEQYSEISEKNIIECLVKAAGQTAESEDKAALQPMEAFFNNIRHEAQKRVKVSFDEPNVAIGPGESASIHVNLDLPRVIGQLQYFEGEIGILNEKISYKIFDSAEI